MKNSPFATVLLTVLAFSAIASAILCILDIKYTRELRSFQMQVNQINNNVNLMNQLAADVVEYSKTHPAIEPILESTGLKAKVTSASTNKAGAK